MKAAPSVTYERNSYFDNAKAVLMFLVVFGHVVESQLTNKGASAFRSVYMFIYLFHMPCFIFISGYFSKKGITLTDALSKFVAPLVVFQVVYYLLDHILGLGQFHLVPFLTVPFHTLWYLLSLFCWTLMLNLIHERYLKPVLVISIIVAVLIGYLSFINRTFSFARTLYFFPFFLLGYHFKQQNLVYKLKAGTFGKPLYAVIFILVCYGCFMYGSKVPVKMLFGSTPFSQVGVDNNTGMLMRLIILVLSIITGLCFFKLMPSGQTFFSQFGAKTLQIFLLHDVLIRLLMFTKAFKSIDNTNLFFAVAVTMSILILLVTSWTVFGKALKQISERTKAALLKLEVHT